MALNGAERHPKTLKLARLLGFAQAYCALGLMENLWAVTRAYEPTGSVGRMGRDSLLIQLGHAPGDTHVLDALVEAGLLDEHPVHGLLVHNWHLKCDDLTHAKLYRQGLKFANGAIPRASKLGQREKERVDEQFWSRIPETLPLAAGEPVQTVAASAEVPGNVIPFRPAAAPPAAPVFSAPLPSGCVAEEALFSEKSVSALNSAEQRLPEPVPEPEPVSVPESTHPLTPARGGGMDRRSRKELAREVERRAKTDEGVHIDRASRQVVEACKVTGVAAVRLQTTVWLAIDAECRSRGQPTETEAVKVAEAMVKAWETFCHYQASGLMRFTYGLVRFLGEGIWAHQGRWPFDQERWRDAKRSAVGCRF